MVAVNVRFRASKYDYRIVSRMFFKAMNSGRSAKISGKHWQQFASHYMAVEIRAVLFKYDRSFVAVKTCPIVGDA